LYRPKRNADILSRYKNNDEVRFRRNVKEMHYVNIELNAGTFYSILQIAYEDKDTFFTTPWINAIKTKGTAAVIQGPTGDKSIIIASVCIVIVLVFIASVIAGVFICRKRQRRNNSYQNSFKSSIKESQIGERSSNTKSTSFAEIGEVNNAIVPDKVKEEYILNRKAPSKDSQCPPIELLKINKQYENMKKDICCLLSTEYEVVHEKVGMVNPSFETGRQSDLSNVNVTAISGTEESYESINEFQSRYENLSNKLVPSKGDAQKMHSEYEVEYIEDKDYVEINNTIKKENKIDSDKVEMINPGIETGRRLDRSNIALPEIPGTEESYESLNELQPAAYASLLTKRDTPQMHSEYEVQYFEDDDNLSSYEISIA